MPKSQLFKIIPDLKIIQNILEAFGLDNLEDTRLFTKNHMNDMNTIEKINKLQDKLKEFYFPCKSKIYLKNIDDKKCITLLRQFVKIYNNKCICMEKSIKGEKTMTYRLLYSKDDFLKSPESKEVKGYILSFE